MKKLLILGLFLILNSSFLLAPTAVKTEERKQKEIECTQKEIKYNDLYKSALSKLREFEGLRLMPYADSHGASIGYGHFIRNGEHFTKITELEAEILLKSDFETAMKTVENNTKYNRYDNPEKVLALAHFVFNFGENAFVNSTMLYNIKHDKPINNEITRWVHAKVNGEFITLNCLVQRRNYELNLYNS